MSAQLIILVLMLTTSLRAADEYPKFHRVEFACDRSTVAAYPTTSNHVDIIDRDSRIPGAGRFISHWNTYKDAPYLLRIDGTIVSDNSASPVPDADLYVGNLQETNILHHYGTSGTNGYFSIWVSIETVDDFKKRLPADVRMAVARSSSWAHATHESMKKALRYLYVGRDGIDLYEYEIPYDKAEPSAPANGATPRR